jgi:signal peptidase I
MNFDKPKRGDVVVFKYPNDTSLDYIKRVIGLPGDVIEMRDKVVFINGEPLKVKQAPSSKVYEQMVEEFKKYNLDHYRSKLGDKNFSLLLSDNRTRGDNIAPFTVPDGQYFVLGDNRDFSMDSRYWGFVPFENIKGKALFVWLSVTNPFGEYSFKFRPDRTGVLL